MKFLHKSYEWLKSRFFWRDIFFPSAIAIFILWCLGTFPSASDIKTWNWKAEAFTLIFGTILATQFGAFISQIFVKDRIADIDISKFEGPELTVISTAIEIFGKRNSHPEQSHPEQSHPEQSHPEQSHPERSIEKQKAYDAIISYLNQISAIISTVILFLLILGALALRLLIRSELDNISFMYVISLFFILVICLLIALFGKALNPRSLCLFYESRGVPPLNVITLIRYVLIIAFVALSMLIAKPKDNKDNSSTNAVSSKL